MAGGVGSRLEPFTKVLPKPLIPVKDKTIIEIIIDEFKKSGINQFYFTLNYRGDRRQDLGVRVGTAHERDVQHSRQLHVGDVPAFTGQEAFGIWPGHRAADIAVRAIDRAERLDCGAHSVLATGSDSPARVRATASMASTMAWYPVQRQ